MEEGAEARGDGFDHFAGDGEEAAVDVIARVVLREGMCQWGIRESVWDERKVMDLTRKSAGEAGVELRLTAQSVKV